MLRFAYMTLLITCSIAKTSVCQDGTFAAMLDASHHMRNSVSSYEFKYFHRTTRQTPVGKDLLTTERHREGSVSVDYQAETIRVVEKHLNVQSKYESGKPSHPVFPLQGTVKFLQRSADADFAGEQHNKVITELPRGKLGEPQEILPFDVLSFGYALQGDVSRKIPWQEAIAYYREWGEPTSTTIDEHGIVWFRWTDFEVGIDVKKDCWPVCHRHYSIDKQTQLPYVSQDFRQTLTHVDGHWLPEHAVYKKPNCEEDYEFQWIRVNGRLEISGQSPHEVQQAFSHERTGNGVTKK